VIGTLTRRRELGNYGIPDGQAKEFNLNKLRITIRIVLNIVLCIQPYRVTQLLIHRECFRFVTFMKD